MVVVFGSINLDLVTRVDRFPAPGETIAGASFATYAGGKGANQALAAARAGATVRMYGAVGRDSFADPALALLVGGGVDLSGVARTDAPTGCATILVDSAGENCIAVAAGANQRVHPDAVPDSMLTPETLLVLQQEVPAAANMSLFDRARRLGARTLLNAAPSRALSLDLLRLLDVLVVNESEATAIAGAAGWPVKPEAFVRAAVAAYPTLSVVVTLGAKGAVARDGDAVWRVAAPEVQVIDTTGAGDAFVGCLAAALDRVEDFVDALRMATAAGSLACTGAGAQSALPGRAAIASLLPLITARGGVASRTRTGTPRPPRRR